MFKLDIEPISHRHKNIGYAHEDYLKKTIENADTIRGLVERARKHNLRVNSTTSASGSKPLDNTKKNRIMRPSSSNQKNKVEVHPRKVKSSLNKMNSVSELISNAHVKHYIRNAKCPLTRITSTKEVPLKETTITPVITPSPELKVVPIVLWVWTQLILWGQFCDSDLEVAFRKHICFIRDLEGVDLLKGSREAVTTACYTQKRSLIQKRHYKTPYKLLHDKKPDISYLHIFGALYYPTNDSEDLGKLKPKADIGIFVGYTPVKKAFRIYNKRTRLITETIHGDFDELTAMASEQFSSGPGPKLLTPGTINSGLVQNIPSSTPYVPPTKNDWEILFQPIFDEYLNPLPCVDLQVPIVIAPKPNISIGTPSSTTLDQDAPSISTSQTNQETPSPVIHFGVEEVGHDIEVTHMDNKPYVDFPVPEPSFKESSSQVVIPNHVYSINQPLKHINKWTKDHLIDNVIGDPSRPVSTRHKL
ncbi:retrovirus-related pol polyprotein from transposon TNT 1-94 [Tanacetum coccineum]